MTSLTKSSLLTAFDVRLALRPVALPGSHQVYIRELTGAGADAFALASQKTPELARATLVTVCACDEGGDLLFAPGDVGQVAQLPNRVLNPIVEAIIAHNHLGPEAAQEAVPFSATGRSNGSGSASPATSAPPSPT